MSASDQNPQNQRQANPEEQSQALLQKLRASGALEKLSADEKRQVEDSPPQNWPDSLRQKLSPYLSEEDGSNSQGQNPPGQQQRPGQQSNKPDQGQR